MPLPFYPNPGTIVVCDFDGFITPEITKRRPCVVISPRLRSRNDLVTIVPFSTTEPRTIEPYHYAVKMNPTMPKPYDSELQWVKADMIYTVSRARLNLPFEKDDAGKRNYLQFEVTEDELKKIREKVLIALSFGN